MLAAKRETLKYYTVIRPIIAGLSIIPPKCNYNTNCFLSQL